MKSFQTPPNLRFESCRSNAACVAATSPKGIASLGFALRAQEGVTTRLIWRRRVNRLPGQFVEAIWFIQAFSIARTVESKLVTTTIGTTRSHCLLYLYVVAATNCVDLVFAPQTSALAPKRPDMRSIPELMLRAAGFSLPPQDGEAPEPLGQGSPLTPRSPDCSAVALPERPRTQELSLKCPKRQSDEAQGTGE